MPGTTPNRGFPFPLDNDQIDVAGDIERLARAVDGDSTGADSRLDAIEGLNSQQDARLAGVEGKNATQDGQINTLDARTNWLRARTQGPVIGGNSAITTNENGDFTKDFPVNTFPPGTGTAVVANIADGNIGAFIVVTFSNSVGVTGRVIDHAGSHTGATANLTVNITFMVFGFMNSGYP